MQRNDLAREVRGVHIRQPMDTQNHDRLGLAILGGGPAGLAAGHFARAAALDFRIFDAAPEVGGNARTLRLGEFLFDTGAHRFHDRIPEVTSLVQSLLGPELLRIDVPSRILSQGKWVAFPLSPFDLLWKLGPHTCARAGIEVLRERLRGGVVGDEPDFETFALRCYGPTLAKRFLISYTEKLWGRPGRELSYRVAGRRLQGLNLRSFLREWTKKSADRVRHLDGAFLYPRRGIGQIAEAFAESCGREHIETGARITRLFHRDGRIVAIEVNGHRVVAVDTVLSTLPLPLVATLLDPAPPDVVLEAARCLRFRNVILVALAVDRASVSPYGSIYFPDQDVPFTRVYEPRNRSAEMAPSGRTLLVAEIACNPGDTAWSRSDESWIDEVTQHFSKFGWFRPEERREARVARIPNAYPVIERGLEARLAPVIAHLAQFENLTVTGRNGRFVYTHIHDMVAFAEQAIRAIVQVRASDPRRSTGPAVMARGASERVNEGAGVPIGNAGGSPSDREGRTAAQDRNPG